MKPVSREILRIIDANLDRAGEGLRVLEDLARLALNNPPLSQKLKELRHNTFLAGLPLEKELLQSRDSGADVGRNLVTADQSRSRDLVEIAVANARRVQEALRVIEEMARVPETALDAQVYKECRFSLYIIERDLVSALLRQDKIAGLRGLYVKLELAGDLTLELTEKILRGGAKAIQLEPISGSARHDFQTMENLNRLCRAHHALLLITDSVDLALAAGIDGVILSRESLPVDTVRTLMPLDVLIGFKTNSMDEAGGAKEDGADFLLTEASGITLPEIRKIGLPVIHEIVPGDHIKDLAGMGADGLAVNAADVAAPDMQKSIKEIVDKLEGKKK